MKDLMTEINTLFGLCEEVNLVLKSVDAYGQRKAINKVNNVSMEVFKDLGIVINPMGKKDLIKEISDRKTILRLYYILLRSLYYFSRSGYGKFEDARCQGATMLAYKLIHELDFENKFGQSQTWINNEVIYRYVFMETVRHMHPTDMQKLIRCLTATLLYPEVKEQKVPDYMERFEGYILYYLMNCSQDERIYLDYI
jgi:hypothetical protein